MSARHDPESRRGVLFAAGAYVLWGLLPVYWKALIAASPTEILAHRMVWSLVFVALILAVRQNLAWLGPALRNKRTLLTFSVSSVLLSVNWGIYIWAVNTGHIVETSLGYFISPLLISLLGVLFLRERLRPLQIGAFALALVGVLWLTFSHGEFPWIALSLAGTWGVYGLIRKTASLGSLQGLTVETLVVLPFAILYLLYLEYAGVGTFGHLGIGFTLLLVSVGIATATPLLFFASAARRVTLSTVGLMQYIAPTIQFLIGTLLYGEVVSKSKLLGFVFVWAGLLIYSVEAVYQSTRIAGAGQASPAE